MKLEEKEAIRLLERFTIFLNFDAQVIVNHLKPNDKNDILRVKKDAIELSIICVEELYLQSDNEMKPFYHKVKEKLLKIKYSL
jgi:hypothetical protein